MHIRDKIGIVCCSNGLPLKSKPVIENLKNTLIGIGLTPVFSPYLYAEKSVFSGCAGERAQALTAFYEDPDIRAIFDISGGDIANEILPFLDFDVIAANPKPFWGYSDLTTLLNAIYVKTGQPGVLYQIRNLVSEHAKLQREAFSDTVLNHKHTLFDFPIQFIQGTRMEGIVLGGNIRCFLKLAGTEFFPDLQGKILFLESRSGQVPQMVTFLSQLYLLGAFDKANGILLGTFTQMEREQLKPDIVSLIKKYAGNLPIAQTPMVGHQTDSRGIVIGEYRAF